MKHWKLFGAAAAAVLAMLALGGTGTATATVLCKFEGPGCSFVYGKGTEIKGTGVGRAQFRDVNSNLIDECESSAFAGQISNAGGPTSTVALSVGSLTWSGCSVGTHVLTKGGSMEIHWLSGRNGTVTDPELEWTWGSSCPYKPESGADVGLLTGSATSVSQAKFTVNLKFIRANPFLTGCPSPLSWLAEIAVGSPTPLYVLSS
jgi:hypothetical protein